MVTLKVENLSAHFGQHNLFKNLSFEMSSGSSCAIVGPNGSGKTTLLHVLCGLKTPSQGNYSFSAENEVQPFLLSSQPAVLGDLTALENMFVYLSTFQAKKNNEDILQAFNAVNLSTHSHKQMKTFSKGQLRRFTLAAIALIQPKILLCDEPTDGLDTDGQKHFYKTLENLKDSLLLIVTHDTELRNWCSKSLQLPSGEFA